MCVQAAKSEGVMEEVAQGSIIRTLSHSYVIDEMDAPTEDDQAPASSGADVPVDEDLSKALDEQAVDMSDEADASNQLTIGEAAVPGGNVAADVSFQNEEQPSSTCAPCEMADLSGKADMDGQRPMDADKPGNTRHYGRFDSSVVNGEATEVRQASPITFSFLRAHTLALNHPILHASAHLSPCPVSLFRVSLGPPWCVHLLHSVRGPGHRPRRHVFDPPRGHGMWGLCGAFELHHHHRHPRACRPHRAATARQRRDSGLPCHPEQPGT
jgi:hypothetical protein